MGAPRNVAVLVGSLRKDSLNRKMANALIRLAPAELSLKIVEIGNLPLYNADHEADPPPVVREFKEAIAKSDAVLFVHARIQPFDARRAEERHRRRIAPLRQERMDGQAGARSSAYLRARSAASAPTITFASLSSS